MAKKKVSSKKEATKPNVLKNKKVSSPKVEEPKKKVKPVEITEVECVNFTFVSKTLSNAEREEYYNKVKNVTGVSKAELFEELFLIELKKNRESLNQFIYNDGGGNKVNLIGFINYARENHL